VIVKADGLRTKMVSELSLLIVIQAKLTEPLLQHDDFIAQDHLILALLQDEQISAALKAAGVKVDALKKAVEELRKGKKVDSRQAESNFDALKK